MPVYWQKFIKREDLFNNRAALFLFGDNQKRVGFGGQAKEMRGEANAVGICTKRAPGVANDDYWYDDGYSGHILVLQKDFRRVFMHIANGGLVIIPADGLGTGLSRLPELAPKTFAYLKDILTHLNNKSYVDMWLKNDPSDGG